MNVHSHVYYIVHMIGHNERFVGADEPWLTQNLQADTF